MEIPSYLETQIKEGNAVLFLGTGTSRDAKDKNDNKPPDVRKLSEILSNRFLGGKFKDYPLSLIGEYAINEADITTVQECIRELFEVFEPTDAHRMMTSFSWHGLATVNYDRLIERAYEGNSKAVQRIRPFIQNGDRIDAALRDKRALPLLKLHGCITRTTSRESPLILATEQHTDNFAGRSRLFQLLEDWGREHPIVFIGNSLQDPDIRAIVQRLTGELKDSRPRYFVVAPNYDEIELRSWEAKKITPLKFTFTSFMLALDKALSSHFRGLAAIVERPQLAITEQFEKLNTSLSEACLQFLQSDVDYVGDIKVTKIAEPKVFYKGSSQGWAAIEQGLDIRRQLGDTILSDQFLISEAEHSKGTELILIKAHAGAGKSVLMRRLAWDATHDYGCICLYLRPHGVISSAAVQEVINSTNKRVFLFVDDAADRIREIQSLIRSIGPEGGRLTLVIAERINEWNVGGGSLAASITVQYDLKYLTLKEIDALLVQLEKHRALGTLEKACLEDKRKAFAYHAGRQLLVALHEATLGRAFEDIIEDEFNHIYPYEAQRIYLSICVLNRLNVCVRAGIISRLYGIRFEDFKERFFAPLENIVSAEYDDVLRDYSYTARHPHIAEIVFTRVLKTAEERFDAYVRCLEELNIDYDDDRRAFRQMIRGRTLIELFADHKHALRIYEVARKQVGEEAYLLHQMALYEMHRPNGNLDVAGELLSEATQLSSSDLTIKHSIAEHLLRRAETARTELQREKYLREAEQQSQALIAARSDEVFPYATQIKVGITHLEALLGTPNADPTSVAVQDVVKNTERKLLDAQQRFPNESYLLDLEAKLANLLTDSGRVVSSLEQAFNHNPQNTYVAIRLARCYEVAEKPEKATDVLKRALNANGGERKLHYAYAKLLLRSNETTSDELTYHLQRSFSPGDYNYDAQLLYGRQLYISGDVEASKAYFRRLGQIKLSPELKERLHYSLPQYFNGRIEQIETTYCFITRDGIGDRVHANRNNIEDDTWSQIVSGTRVTFRVGFSLKGPSAFEIALELQPRQSST